jgi:hypothetical protein
MKRRKFIKTAGVAGAGMVTIPAFIRAQETITAVSNVGEDLDLYAVLDLLEESENLEEFEKALNSEEKGINNLDLNEDGEVDYIKVEETVEENTHLIVLQVEIEENDFQDVATIEIEKKAEDDISVQAVGAEEFYGEDYIIEPVTEKTETTTTVVHVHTWPLILFIFRPRYSPWRSPWRWRARPIWLGQKCPPFPVQKNQNKTQQPQQKYVQDTTENGKKISKIKKAGDDTEERYTA